MKPANTPNKIYFFYYQEKRNRRLKKFQKRIVKFPLAEISVYLAPVTTQAKLKSLRPNDLMIQISKTQLLNLRKQ